MTLRNKTILIISVTLTGLIAIVYLVARLFLLGRFVAMEEAAVRQNVARAQNLLNRNLDTMHALAVDWAYWDDTLTFVQDKNPAYIASNLPNTTLTNLQLHFMVFANTDGEIVYSKWVNLETGQEAPLPESLKAHLQPGSLLFRHTEPLSRSHVTGLLLLPEGPVAVTAVPILNSDDEGPSGGTLVMGRLLDEAEIARLSETAEVPFAIQIYQNAGSTPDLQAACPGFPETEPLCIYPLDAKHIAGCAILQDIYGNEDLRLQVDMPRAIYRQGQTSMLYFVLAALAAGAIFALAMLMLLERQVLQRLTHLGEALNAITASGDPSRRIPIHGDDELAALGIAINRMLAALEHSQHALRAARDQLEMRVQERTAELTRLNRQLQAELAERQRVEAALARSERDYRTLFEHAHDAILVFEPEQEIVLQVNRRACELYGFSPDEFIGMSLKSISKDVRRGEERVAQTLAQGSNVNFETVQYRKDGSEMILEINASVVEYHGQPAILSINRDITHRKEAEAQIRASLQEKETLLREIHHRVKNNLQIISSLLSLQTDAIADPQIASAFRDSQNRIRAMALIHEKLYRSENLARINFASYLEDLTFFLFRIYNASEAGIVLQVRADDLSLDIDTALPCGLILNELVANALKHAFPPGAGNGTEKRVVVGLQCLADNQAQLSVQDNGVGLPAGFNLRQTESLGLQLVQTLARQLDGCLQVNSHAGAHFRVIFPLSTEVCDRP